MVRCVEATSHSFGLILTFDGVPPVTIITSATTTNACQLAQSRSLRVYVRTPTRHIEAHRVIASFREIPVTETRGSRKMNSLKRSVLKVGLDLLGHSKG
jgi:hypothetical protein